MTRFSTVVGALSLLPSVLALANVTARRIEGSTCQKFPGALPLAGGDHSDASRYIQLVIDQPEDTAVDGLYAFDMPYEWLPSRDAKDFVLLKTVAFDLRKSRSFARIYFRCFDGVLRLGTDFDHALPSGYNTSQLPSLTVHKDKDVGALLFTNDTLQASLNITGQNSPWPGYPVDAYAHYDPVTNERLPGVFLGALNSTTWNFAYHAEGPFGEPFRYQTWLNFQADGPKDKDAQFQGFIKIIEYS